MDSMQIRPISESHDRVGATYGKAWKEARTLIEAEISTGDMFDFDSLTNPLNPSTLITLEVGTALRKST